MTKQRQWADELDCYLRYRASREGVGSILRGPPGGLYLRRDHPQRQAGRGRAKSVSLRGLAGAAMMPTLALSQEPLVRTGRAAMRRVGKSMSGIAAACVMMPSWRGGHEISRETLHHACGTQDQRQP
jgi:hypothetical protein